MTVTPPANENVHDSVELPDPPETDSGLREHEELSLDNATVPANPFEGEREIVDVPVWPTTSDRLAGLAEMLKSPLPPFASTVSWIGGAELDDAQATDVQLPITVIE